MRISEGFEFPPGKQRELRRARRLEWLTLAYLVSAIIVIAVVMGSSQAMRTAWFDDILSLIPPTVFLIASRISQWAPNERFPYGYHRATAAAYLASALALVAMGGFLLIEAVLKLARAEHPTIGTVEILGESIWLGWLMLPALLWSALPAAVLGRMKLPLAEHLHDRVLYADAKMNKADWLVAVAAGVGVLGVGAGFWWTDAVAAAVVSLDILYDGWSNSRVAVSSLMDERPQKITRSGDDPLPQRLEALLRDLDWVREVEVRVRDEGHVLFGEALVVPRDSRGLAKKIAHAIEEAKALDWRLHEMVITPVGAIGAGARSEREQPARRAAAPRAVTTSG